MQKKVWILADDRMGNVNQLLGIAESLGFDFEIKEIRYDSWIRLPNFLRRASLIGLTEASKKNVSSKDFPDLVLSAGRRSFPVALWLKKQSLGKTKIVQLMNPGRFGFSKADLVVLPAHDNYKASSSNVIISSGTPHRLSLDRLEKERVYWEPFFSSYPHKRVSLIVGGATKDNPFTIDMAQDLVDGVLNLKPNSILITTSRRTPDNVVQFLEKKLSSKTTYFYKFGDQAENPYFGLMACADQIVVTGDSMSMCSECCAVGVSVYIYAPQKMMSKKHLRFHESLYKNGYAIPLGSKAKSVKGGFNPTNDIKEKIYKLFEE